MTIDSQIASLRARMEAARKGTPLATPSVTLLGASKAQPASLIEQAIAAGVTVFGENRVQEAADKWPDLRERHPGVKLHLIGPLQSNKAKSAVQLFDAIQTIDRTSIADALAEAMEQLGRKLDCYIQVNTGKEPQKAGVMPDEADALIEYCSKILPVVGLMCVPPADQPPAPHFALLHEMASRHGLKELSMGMSEDFEVAIRMGSTCVRLGRALFGERD